MPGAADAAPAGDPVAWSVTYPDQRPWTEMWALVQHNLAVLDDRYERRIPTADGSLVK